MSEFNSKNFNLKKTNRGLELFVDEQRSLFLDFVNDSKYRRPHRGKNELIAKALGYSSGFREVWDLTAGLCEDALFISQLGFKVSAFERHPQLAALIADALDRLKLSKPENKYSNISLKQADSINFLSEISDASGPEVLYLDPMFEYSKIKSALPRIEMQIFRALVGPDVDAKELLQQAIRVAKKRVVVKRPRKELPMLDQVQHSFEGRAVSYDLYMPRALRG